MNDYVLGDITAVTVAGALACLMSYAMFRAAVGGRLRDPRPLPEPVVIDAEWAAERLMDSVARHRSHTFGRTIVGDVEITARWAGDRPLRGPPYGHWILDVAVDGRVYVVDCPSDDSLRDTVVEQLRELAGAA